MRFKYNDVARENGWGKFPYTPGEPSKIEDHETIGYTNFKCTIAGVIDKTYNKMPLEDMESQVIMEYDSYLQVLGDNTVFNETYVDAETALHFKDWMRDTPNLAY
jgi:hypothetical protein